jgi:hypothetical protein
MATFNSFANTLPDPLSPITVAGATDPAGTPGPGFASMTLRSNKDTQVSKTISGRGVHRETGAHHWEIEISYNPMLRDQFDPVDTFLLGRNSRLNPFYVILPQHAKPKDASFASYVTAYPMTTWIAYAAGVSAIVVQNTSAAVVGSAKPGDIFTLSDPTNTNHQKVYKITRVETNALYQAGTSQPSSFQQRIHFMPPLQRNTAAGSAVNFLSPKFRVIAKSDVQEYQLNTDNLYSFSLSLEEVQP